MQYNACTSTNVHCRDHIAEITSVMCTYDLPTFRFQKLRQAAAITQLSQMELDVKDNVITLIHGYLRVRNSLCKIKVTELLIQSYR